MFKNSYLGFQNYPEEQDLLEGTVTEAECIGSKQDLQFKITSYVQFGPLLPLQVFETYSLDSQVENQLEKMVSGLNEGTQSLLGLLRSPFTISSPVYDGPAKVEISLNRHFQLNKFEVVLPSSKAQVAFENPKTGEKIEGPLQLPGATNFHQPMKNYCFGGWAPIEPEFMDEQR